jgi:selenide,water dikinase
LPAQKNPNLIVGSENSDDAGVLRIRSDLAVVTTVDFFTPIVDHPYEFGRIAAANALSDVYAMGARPVAVLNILAFPSKELSAGVMAEILRGGAERAAAAGAVVVGGHTVSDPELKYGMAVTGLVHPKRVVRNGGARRGDLLILTKPLGTGIVATGIKRGGATIAEEEAAVRSMTALNDVAGSLLQRFRARACTDITGFGLAGHAAEMAMASRGVRLEFDAESLPLLPGTARLAENGFVTGGSRSNHEYLGRKLKLARGLEPGVVEAVVDPQTSGGLLVSLPRSQAPDYVERLHRHGLRPVVVGRVSPKPQRSPHFVTVE